MSKRMKKIHAARPTKPLSLAEALKHLKANANAKFDETLEIAMNLGVDPRQGDQNVRGVVAIKTGKTMRVAVFAKGEKAEAAKAAGADYVGAEDLAAQIEAGTVQVDRVIATPDTMVIVGKVAKILGPRGLMPNPKLGTVTPNAAEAVKAAKAGSVEFRVEKAGIVQAGLGKLSFSEDALAVNVRAFIGAVLKAKPATSKGNYVRRISLSSTMGAGIRLDIAATLAEVGAV